MSGSEVQNRAPNQTLRIALAQLSSGPDRADNLRRCLAACDEAAARGARLVCFPEVVLDRFFPAEPGSAACDGTADDGTCRSRAHALAEPIPGPATEAIAAKAKEHGLVVVFNLYEVDESGEASRYFDSSPVIDADGTLLGTTRMIHITDYEGFYEQDYYDQGDKGAPVYDTAVGRLGVAICYDRHYPEYMRALAVAGADLVLIPQAGTIGEWPDGLFEAEVRTAAFQNGYFAALCNRVGVEETLTFAGESFVTAPDGTVLARGKSLEDDLVVADLDLSACDRSSARTLFFRDRRPELYADWLATDPPAADHSKDEI